MLRVAHETVKAKKGQQKTRRLIRFPGLMTAADKLGVHRNHLYLVLTGQRTSHRLLRRYQALKKEAA